MRMKEHLEDQATNVLVERMTMNDEAKTPAKASRKKTQLEIAEDFARLCWKTQMYNREIAAFLEIPERRLYRYLAGTSRIPPQIVKLLTLKANGVIA